MRRACIWAASVAGSAAIVATGTGGTRPSSTERLVAATNPAHQVQPTDRTSPAGPYVIDMEGCEPAGAREHHDLANTLLAGSGTQRLQRVIWTEEAGPAGELYFFQAADDGPVATEAEPTVVDPKDGTFGYFWSRGRGVLSAALNGFRTDPARGVAMADALSRGSVPEGYVSSSDPVDLSGFRAWEYTCVKDGRNYGVRAVQGSAAARAVYIAGSTHTRVIADTEDATVMEYGGDAPVRPASVEEWRVLTHTKLTEDAR